MERQKYLVDIKLSDTVIVKVEGYYSGGSPAVFYHKDGSGTPEEPPEFEIINIYDSKLRNITDLFECFDNFMVKEIASVIKATKSKHHIGSQDVWCWLENLTINKLGEMEALESKYENEI